jgi:hypothetical protein
VSRKKTYHSLPCPGSQRLIESFARSPADSSLPIVFQSAGGQNSQQAQAVQIREQKQMREQRIAQSKGSALPIRQSLEIICHVLRTLSASFATAIEQLISAAPPPYTTRLSLTRFRTTQIASCKARLASSMIYLTVINPHNQYRRGSRAPFCYFHARTRLRRGSLHIPQRQASYRVWFRRILHVQDPPYPTSLE